MLPPSDSITVVVTAVAHTVPLADGISEAEYEREGSDPDEQFHAKQRIGTAHCFLLGCRDFCGNQISELGSKK
jgi:hypothetical protein